MLKEHKTKEQDIEYSNLPAIPETAIETAENLSLPAEISEIAKTMMPLEQIAEKLEKISQPIYEHAIDQSFIDKCSSLTADKLKEFLEALPEDAADLIKQSEDLIESAKRIVQGTQQFKSDSKADFTNLNSVLEAILAKIQQIKNNMANVSLFKEEAQALSPIYIQKKIKESGFASMEDLSQKLDAKRTEYYDIDRQQREIGKGFFGLKRFLKKKEINQLKEQQTPIKAEMEEMEKLQSNLNQFAYFEVKVPRVESATIESLTTLEGDVLTFFVPKIQEQYDLYLQEANLKSKEEEEKVVTPELINQLNDEFIQKYVMPEIEKQKSEILEKCFGDEKTYQDKISQAFEILKRSFAIISFRPMKSADYYEKEKKIGDDLNALYPYSLRIAIEKFIDYQKETTAEDDYQVIADFLANLSLLLKRKRVITSYQQVLDTLIKTVTQNYHLSYNARSQEYKLKDKQRELDLDDLDKQLKNFVYKFVPEQWEICKNNQEFKKLFLNKNQLSAEQVETVLEQEVMQEYLRAFRKSGYSAVRKLGPKLRGLKTEQTIPLAIFDTYYESHYLQSGEDTGFYQFCNQLADEQIGQLEKKTPEAAEIIKLIQQNPETFQNQQIENPQLLEFGERLKNDNEFLDLLIDDQYSEIDNFALLLDRPDEDTNYSYDEKTRTLYISKQEIENNFPDFTALISSPFTKTDELFTEFKRALTKSDLKNCRIEKNKREDVKERSWDYRGDRRAFLLPKEEADNFLTKLNYDEDIFLNRYVDNPVYLKIRQNLVKMAVSYFEKGENAQYYLLNFLGQINVDLGRECYQEIEKLFSEATLTIRDTIVNFAINRVVTQKDSQAAALLLQNYKKNNAIWRKERLQQISGDLIGSFVNKEIDQESLAGLSQILGKTTEEISQTFSFLSELQKLGHSYESGKCNDYFELASQPEVLSLIQDLYQFGYYFIPQHTSLLPDLVAHKTEIISQIQDIRALFPYFNYNPREIYSYNFETKQIENFFTTDPYEILPPQINREQLFQNFYQKQKEQGFLDRKFSDGFMRSLRTDDPTYQNQPDKKINISEEEYQTFNTGIEKLLNEFCVSPENNKELFERYQDPKILQLMARQPEQIGQIKEVVPLCLNQKQKIQDFILNNLERLTAVPKEKRLAYIEIVQKIDASNSQEIQRIKEVLLKEVLNTDDPIRSYDKIEHIFAHNLLPSFGKAFKIFATLHSVKEIQTKMQNQGSPIIRRVLHRGASERNYQVILKILYRDLLKIHLLSANRSLREYIELLLKGEKILNEAEKAGIENLDEAKQEELNDFLSRLETLLISSFLGQRIKAEINTGMTLEAKYQHLRESFEVQEGQTILQRINEMFLKPAGLHSLEEILDTMRQTKEEADKRGQELANSSPNGYLETKEGDLLKGVDIKFISNILQGPVCKEFLGPFSATDGTPLDTDLSKVLPEDLNQGFRGAIDQSMAQSYGRLLLVIREREQFQKDFELFPIGGRHYGIRTGFPATQIEFMIAQDDLIQDKRALEKIYYEIAQNGYYVPITDTQGKIIFTPEMHNEYRQTFDGLDRFDGQDFQFLPTLEGDLHFKQIQEIISEMPLIIKKNGILSQHIRGGVKSAIKESGIRFRARSDDPDLSGAELLDTGSTGRGTNVPGEQPDFDFILNLDAGDFSRANQVAEKIKSKFTFEEQAPLVPQRDNFQLLTLNNITEIEIAEGKKKIEPAIKKIELGFVKKSELAVFGSHTAVEEKLNSIKENKTQAIANIILAKLILKAGGAYSRQKEGGWGGIGTENWILANHGNLLSAFESFIKSAYDENGNLIPFEKFKDEYKVLNAGMNIKLLYHDNYTANMNKEGRGYQAMVKTIEVCLAMMEKIQKKEMPRLNLEELLKRIKEEVKIPLTKEE